MAGEKRKPKNYLNNADLVKQVKLSREQGKMTDELAKMLMMLTERYAMIPRFSGYSYNNDMQSFALMTLMKVWKGYDENKSSNAFAYFTQIVHNAFFQYDNTERRQRQIRDSILVSQGRNPSFNYLESASRSNSDDIMDSYGDADYMERDDFDKNNTIDDTEDNFEIDQANAPVLESEGALFGGDAELPPSTEI